MKIQKTLLGCFFLVFGIIAESFGQQQVFATAGEHAVTNNTQLTWTIGQVVNSSASSNTIYLGAGFHQGDVTLSVVSSLSEAKQQIHIYPNPTTDYLDIQPSERSEEGGFQLINSLGKVILDEQQVDFSNKKTIAMHDYSDGVYVLRINIENQPIQQFKIIKK